jgi:hypothetical protein
MTGDPSEVTLAIKDLLQDNQQMLGLNGIYYGDQERIPTTPAVAVEAGPYTAELMPSRVRHNFSVFLLIYHSKLQDGQTTKLECDQFAERVRDLLHGHRTLDGLVIHGFVSAMDPGYALRAGALLRANRVTWDAISHTVLPT